MTAPRIEVRETDDLETCLKLRRVVFIEEQNVSEEEEFDGRDGEAIHLLAYVEGVAMGSARLFVEEDIGKIGRVCVLKEARGSGVGKALIEASLAHFAARGDVRTAKLGAQTHALGFYAALGFEAFGPEYMDAGIPHRDMKRAV